MQHPYRYRGCFIPTAQLEEAIRHVGERLAKPVLHPHVTFAYLPETVDTALFGERLTLRAVGYGNDGQNEGLLVQPVSIPARLKPMFDSIEVPHVTLSVGEHGEAVNTRYLQFHPIEPFEIEGVFGGFIDSKTVVLTP